MKKGLLAAIAILLSVAPARAQFPGDTPNDLRFRLGGIYADLNAKATFETSDVPSGEIDLSNVFGNPDHKFTFRGDGSWNFAGRSFLDFGYVSFSQERSNSISRDITFGGVTYTAGAEVSSETLARFIYAAYRYGFVKNESFQLGLSLGISYTTLRAQLAASAGVVGPNGPIVGPSTVRKAEINAPVPLIGLDAEGALGRNLSLGARVRAFKATIDPYSGNMVEAMAHMDWYPSPHFGVGGGFEWTKIHIEKNQDTRDVAFN